MPLDDAGAFARAIRERTPIIPKADFVLAHCRNRSVLDIGCIDHSAATAIELGPNWLHEAIRKVADEVVGLDSLAEEAELLNERGYRIEVGNAELLNLNRVFDVVVAGDLIEHLSNPGSFLDATREHLRSGGRLVLTTPNPFNVEQAIMVLRHRRVQVNAEHTCWFDPITLHQLVRRHRYSVESFAWIETRFAYPSFKHQPARWLAQRFVRLAHRLSPPSRRDFGFVLVRP